jgi:hypothetical protein
MQTSAVKALFPPRSSVCSRDDCTPTSDNLRRQKTRPQTSYFNYDQHLGAVSAGGTHKRARLIPPRLGVSFYFGTTEGTPRRGGAVKSKHAHMLSDLSPGNASKPPKDGSAKLLRQNFTMLMCE